MESHGKAIRFLRIKRHTKEIKLEEMTDKSKTDVNLCMHFIHYNAGKYLKYNHDFFWQYCQNNRLLQVKEDTERFWKT